MQKSRHDLLGWVSCRAARFCYNRAMNFANARRLAGAALAALALLAVRHHYAHPHTLHTGDRLVPIALLSLDGSRTSLAASGRPQVINVFATWCPPCRAEMPAFAKSALKWKARGIDVVGIDQQESAAAVWKFAQLFALPYPVFIDAGNVTHDILGARMIPTTIFVDGSGVIRWERSGPLDGADLKSLAAVAEAP